MTTKFNLELLLARADDHKPLLDGGLPLASAASAPKPPKPPRRPDSLRNDSGDPNVLRQQRWGIVAPEGPKGDRLLELVAELEQARSEQQQADVIVYRVPPGMSTAASVAWKDRIYNDDSVPLSDLPRYLLILGELDQVSLELQQSLATDVFVGRLAARTEEGYGAYVQKLLRAERTPAAVDRAKLHFFTVRDGTAATSISQQSLVAPSIARCLSEQERGVLPIEAVAQIPYDPRASSAAFLAQAATREPAIFFTVSHGLGPPRDGWKTPDDQRALQGSMVLGSRPGERLTAKDVEGRPFMPSGVWFFMACYGGAVPSSSVYHAWLKRLNDAGAFPGRVDTVLDGLARNGMKPFLSALPLAALANPNGPLAVLAHADLAWTYSFQDMDGDARDRPARFEGVFRALAETARVGPAHREIIRTMTEKGEELLTMPDDAPGAPSDAAKIIRRANLWMLRHDLAGYMILGDPAARLPLPREPAPAAPIPRYEAHGIAARDPMAAPHAAGAPFAVADEPRRAAGPARDPARMARAVLEVLREQDVPKKIAERYGVSRDELQRWVDTFCDAGRAALGEL